MYGGGGDQAFYFSPAQRALLFIWRAKGLDLLKAVTASFAAVFIERHLQTPVSVTITVANFEDRVRR